MNQWERAELVRQRSKVSDKMTAHYDRCGICCDDAMNRRETPTCSEMQEFQVKLKEFDKQLGEAEAGSDA